MRKQQSFFIPLYHTKANNALPVFDYYSFKGKFEFFLESELRDENDNSHHGDEINESPIILLYGGVRSKKAMHLPIMKNNDQKTAPSVNL